jgi:hypothetical protein
MRTTSFREVLWTITNEIMVDRNEPVADDAEEKLIVDLVVLEDVPAEIEQFAELSRLGLFAEAKECFEEMLRAHIENFVVLQSMLISFSSKAAMESSDRLLTSGLMRVDIYPNCCE